MLSPLCRAQSGRSSPLNASSTQSDSPDFIKDLIETRRRYREASGVTAETAQRSVRPGNRSPRTGSPGSPARRTSDQGEVVAPTTRPTASPLPAIRRSAAPARASALPALPPEASPAQEQDRPGVEKSEPPAASTESEPAYPVVERRVSAATPLPEAARQLFEDAMKAFAARDYESARLGFERVLELAPDHPVVLVNLGTVCWRLGESDQAIEYLSGAVSRDLNNAPAWLGLGIVRFESGDLAGAHAALAHAHYLDPRNPRANNYLGVTMTRLNHYDAAESFILDAIDADPDYAEAHFNLAVVYLRREPIAPELARRHYRRSVDLGGEPDAGVEAALQMEQRTDR